MKEEPLELSIDWDAPAELGPTEGVTTVAIIDRRHQADFGFSPQFPSGVVLYFRADEPHALVFEGEAAASLLGQMRSILISLGIVEVVETGDPEEVARIQKKVTLPN